MAKGSGSTPKNTPDNLFSFDSIEAILGISEGPIKGQVGPQQYYIGETPLQSIGGTNNFTDFELKTFNGYESGEPITAKLGGFGAATSANSGPLAKNVAVTRSVLAHNINFIDIRLVFSRLYSQTSKGVFNAESKFKIEYKKDSDADYTPILNLVDGNNEIITPDFSQFSSVTGLANSVGDTKLVFLQTGAPSLPSQLTGIWFNSTSGQDYKPSIITNGPSYFPPNLTKVAAVTDVNALYWTWTEGNTDGSQEDYYAWVSTQAQIGLLNHDGLLPDIGDYWIITDLGKVCRWNGNVWVSTINGNDPSVLPGVPLNPAGSGEIRIYGKQASSFVKQARFQVPNVDEGLTVRVTKLNDDTSLGTTGLFCDVVWESFLVYQTNEVSYPSLSVTQFNAKATDQFSSVPDLSGIYWGRIVKIPSNYNPVTRVYTGMWDGTWKIDYTDNPAYIGYDLVENTRYGLSAFYPVTLNKWDVYDAGQWCDVRAFDGSPRYTFNGLIQEAQLARPMIDYIFGIFGGRFVDDGNGSGRILIDRDQPAVYLFNKENVSDSIFTYSFTDPSTRKNDITISWTDPSLGWKENRRRIFDQAAIDRFGTIQDNPIAVGCIYQGEVIRRVRYQLITGQTEKIMTSFKTDRNGMYLEPYNVILIADDDVQNVITGRVLGNKQRSVSNLSTVGGNPISIADPRRFILKRPVNLETGIEYKAVFNAPTGVAEVDIDPASVGVCMEIATQTDLPDLPVQTPFAIQAKDQPALPKPYRVMTIGEGNTEDEIEITGIEVNRTKMAYVDGLVDSY